MKKKVFLVLLVMSLAHATYAFEPIRFGLVGGLNVSKYSSSFINSRVGFHVGGKMELPLPLLENRTFVDASLLLSLKGGKTDWGNLGKATWSPYYLEIPLNFGYKYSFNDKISAFGKFGPYFACGLFGKLKITDGVYSDASSISIFDELSKRFDLGLGLHAGVEVFTHFQFTIGYEWGLIKLNKEDQNNSDIELAPNVKNRNFMITLGYIFGRL